MFQPEGTASASFCNGCFLYFAICFTKFSMSWIQLSPGHCTVPVFMATFVKVVLIVPHLSSALTLLCLRRSPHSLGWSRKTPLVVPVPLGLSGRGNSRLQCSAHVIFYSTPSWSSPSCTHSRCLSGQPCPPNKLALLLAREPEAGLTHPPALN